jgi:hypothetical protein
MIAIDRGLTVCGVAALALLAPVPGDCDATEPRHLVGWYYHRHGIYLPNTDQQLRRHIAEVRKQKKERKGEEKKLRVVPSCEFELLGKIIYV